MNPYGPYNQNQPPPYGSNPNDQTVAGGFSTQNPYPYPPPANYPPPQNYPPYPPPQQQRKWYQTNLGIIALLILFFPVGLYLMWRYATWQKGAKWMVTGLFAALVIVNGIANAAAGTRPVTSTEPTSVAQVTTVPTPTPSPTAAPVHYPPTTEADLHGLAAKGNASAIHEFHSESVGLTGACPQPKREVTVDPGVTGQQLAEDLLAYFYAQHLDSPCGSIVFAYHNQTEANDAYTAGRINVDVTDASGGVNVDPNASNLKHELTLDIGGAYTSQGYVVKY